MVDASWCMTPHVRGLSCRLELWSISFVELETTKEVSTYKERKKKIEIHETRNVDQCYQSAKKRKR